MNPATSTEATPAKKRKKAPGRHAYAIVQADGSFRCADQYSRDLMHRAKLQRGQLVRFSVQKPRDYTQWKKAHALGTLLVQSLEDFAEFMGEKGKPDAHGALKKLQRLSGVECEDSEIQLPGLGKVIIRQPNSLAFEEMEETRFQAAYAGFCDHLVKTWWGDLDQADIEHMASLVGLSS